jgi:protein-disulfide isomerase
MHDKLFANQSSLKVADLKRYASDVGLKMEPFNKCLDSGKYRQRVQDDSAEGTGYGITGTPSFFINGRLLVGAALLEDFAQVIDEELRRGRSNSSANGHFSASYEEAP